MHIQMNDRMAFLYRPSDSPTLPADLEDILLGGFVSGEGCAFFGKFMEPNEIASRDSLGSDYDEIQYECFVNHFHVKGESDRELVSIAVELFRRAHAIWDNSGLLGELRFIVSVKDQEATIRFHLIREGIQWLADDLNLYNNEAVLVYDTIARKDI